MRVAGYTIGLAFVIAALGPAGASDDTTELGPIVARLGSPDFREREQASRDLWALGADALAGIEALRKSVRDPEARRRLGEIADKLAFARLTEPTRVTLDLTDTTAAKAFDRIAKASGYKIITSGLPADVRHTYRFVEVPFWAAVDAVSADAGCTAQHSDDQGNLRVYANNSYSPYVAYSGPFKIVATNINAGQSLQLAGIQRDQPLAGANDSLNLNLQIYAEAKTPMVAVGQPEILSAVDEDGRSLVPRNTNRSTSRYPTRMNYRSFNMSTSVNLSRTDRAARTIKEIEGTIPVMVLAEVRPGITIDKLEAGKEYKGESETFHMTLTDVVDLKPGIGFTIKFDRKDGDPNDYSWYNTLRQRVAVFDGKGKEFASNGVNFQQSSQSTCTLKMTYRPQDANGGKVGKPGSLVVYDWITRTTDVTFTLKDVPMP